MNEIERALATLQDLLDNSIFTSRIDFALEVAIESLREQAERSKGCVWCNENNKVYHDGQHFHFFCSYCGKRLEVEHE